MDPARAARFPFQPSQPPLTVVGAEGNHLLTDNGRRILDGAGGAIVNNIGYGRPEMAERAAEVLDGSGYVLPLFATEWRVRLVERLVDRWLPDGLTRCLFVGGGSESVDSALRMVRHYHRAKGATQRWRVLGRSVSYHGVTLGSLAVGNHDRRRGPMGPALAEQPTIDIADADAAIRTIEAAGPETVGGVIAEPVIGAAAGAFVPPDDYWPTLREYCTANDILLIADEVMTGLGRTGTTWGVDQWGVVPDIMVGTKGLAGGYAGIGGIFATNAVTDTMADEQVMYFTFSGSDLACGLADKTLEILEDERLVGRAAERGAELRALLDERFADHPHVSAVRGLGLMQGIELVRDRSTGETFGGTAASVVVEEALARDVWVYPAGSGPFHDAVMFGPGFTITSAELGQLVDVTADAIDAAVARLA